MARRLRWQALMAVGGGLLALLLLYLGYITVTTEQPDYGGAYVEGVVGVPSAINPLFAFRNDADQDLSALIFSGLTRRKGQGEVEPELARSWQVSPDGKVYTFYLRDDVTWHDGAPFTAADVVFTFKTIQDPTFNFAGTEDLAKLWRQVQVRALNDYTVQFTLREPFAPLLSYTTLGILPAHILGNTAAAQLENSPFNANPVGTGPFRLKDATIEAVTLEANPDYFRGRPYLNNLVFRYYPDYPTAITALRQKKIQGLLLRPEEVSQDELDSLTSGKAWKPYPGQSPRYHLIFLNLKLPLFQDKAVRQALLYALDREALVKAVAGGQGQVANSPLIPGTWAHSPGEGYSPAPGEVSAPPLLPSPTPTPPPAPGRHTVKAGDTLLAIAIKYGITQEAMANANALKEPYLLQIGQELVIPGVVEVSATPTPQPSPTPPPAPRRSPVEVKTPDYDPERAQALLQEAGWKRGSDGVWAKGGQKLSFLLFSYNDPSLVRLGNEAMRQWAEAGIKVEFQQSGLTGLLQNFVQLRKFDAFLASWDMGYDPDLYSAWHSSQIKEDGYNFSSFSRPKADELLLKGRRTVEQGERIAIYQEFQELFAEEVPALLLYYPNYLYLVDREVQGVRLGVLFEPSDRFSQISNWYVKTKRAR